MFTIPGIRVHGALEWMFTFGWNLRSRCPGIRTWDEQVIPLSPEAARDKLKNGRPRLVMFEDFMSTRCMEDGEEVLAARLLKQFFQEEAEG